MLAVMQHSFTSVSWWVLMNTGLSVVAALHSSHPVLSVSPCLRQFPFSTTNSHSQMSMHFAESLCLNIVKMHFWRHIFWSTHLLHSSLLSGDHLLMVRTSEDDQTMLKLVLELWQISVSIMESSWAEQSGHSLTVAVEFSTAYPSSLTASSDVSHS